MKKVTFILFTMFLGFSAIAQKDEAIKLVNQGVQKIASEDCAGAIKDFEMAMKKDPTNLDAYLKRAFCLMQAGNYDAAIADYTSVIKLKPDQTNAYITRGAAKNKLKKYNEALLDFDKAIELDPNSSQAYYNRGEAKKALGDNDGACKDWNTSKKKGNEEAKIVLKNNHCR